MFGPPVILCFQSITAAANKNRCAVQPQFHSRWADLPLWLGDRPDSKVWTFRCGCFAHRRDAFDRNHYDVVCSTSYGARGGCASQLGSVVWHSLFCAFVERHSACVHCRRKDSGLCRRDSLAHNSTQGRRWQSSCTSYDSPSHRALGVVKPDALPIESKVIDLSVVFITYNRSRLLGEAIESLRGALRSSGYSYELIIADDCSSDWHKEAISQIANTKVVRTNQNSGLGANVNNGLASCRGRLILQLQDDWKWVGAPDAMIAALNFVENDPEVGILQLTQVGSDLPPIRRSSSSLSFQIFKNDHIPWMRGCGVRPYSDQPHIKRRSFTLDVGPYLEYAPMTVCENNYKHRVSNQSIWRVAMVEKEQLFIHLGAATSFNPGGRRHPLIKALHRLPGGARFVDPAIRGFVRFVDNVSARLMAK